MAETVRRMVTSCPECETHFYVKPEQLAARKGFVRCGHCQHRFNALEFMLPERELQIDFSSLAKLSKGLDEIPSTPNIPPPIVEVEEAYAPTALADAVTSMPLNTDDIVKTPSIEQLEAIVGNERVALLADTSIESQPEEFAPIQGALQEDKTSKSSDQPQLVSLADIEPETPQGFNSNLLEAMQDNFEALQTEPNSAIMAVKGVTSSDTDFAKKSGFKQKKSKNKAVTFTYALLIIMLILFVTAQTLYYCRTTITSELPQTKPYFEQACLVIGCVIELPKDITKINIDDSDLKEDATYQGLIRVSATIINQAAVNMAYPNLELTLTDEDNKPLLRRIFKPTEYLEKKIPVDLGLPSNQETYVNLNMSVAGSAVVGYRLLPSYD